MSQSAITGNSRKADLSKAIYERLGSYEVTHVLDLLTLLRDDAKEALTSCDAEMFRHLQGRVKAFEDAIRAMTRPSPVINRGN